MKAHRENGCTGMFVKIDEEWAQKILTKGITPCAKRKAAEYFGFDLIDKGPTKKKRPNQ